jgi:hypothetical protein
VFETGMPTFIFTNNCLRELRGDEKILERTFP